MYTRNLNYTSLGSMKIFPDPLLETHLHNQIYMGQYKYLPPPSEIHGQLPLCRLVSTRPRKICSSAKSTNSNHTLLRWLYITQCQRPNSKRLLEVKTPSQWCVYILFMWTLRPDTTRVVRHIYTNFVRYIFVFVSVWIGNEWAESLFVGIANELQHLRAGRHQLMSCYCKTCTIRNQRINPFRWYTTKGV